MLHLILGRAGTGKSTRLRQEMRRLASRGRVILIAPEQFTFESQRAVLAMPRETAERIRVCSFTSLALELTRAYGAGDRPAADAPAQNVLMSLALEDLSEELTVFSRCAGRPASVRELVSTMTELARCGVDADKLRSAADLSGSDILARKARELGLISRRYGALLEQFCADDRYTLDDAARLIRKHRPFEDDAVFIDEFYGFTQQEYDVIEALLATCGDVYAAVCADSVGDRTGGAGALAYTAETAARLRSCAVNAGVDCAAPVLLTRTDDRTPPAIRALEEYLYSPEAVSLDVPTEPVTATVCTGVWEECDCVARRIKRLVREDGYRYRDIAVIDRAGDVTGQLVYALRKYGVPVFEDTRRALEGDILVRFTESALRLTCGFDTQTALSMLKTGLFGLTDDEIALLEDYTTVWRVEGGAWLRPFTRNPDGYDAEETDATRAELARLEALRLRVTEPIAQLAAGIGDAPGREAVKALYEFLIRVGAPGALEARALRLPDRLRWTCERSWDVLMDVFNRFASAVGDRVLTGRRFTELFHVMTSAADVGDMPAGMDEITVGQADRIRTSGKKAVFVCGLNDGKFPLIASPSFVLNDTDRRALARHGAPLADDGVRRVQKERFLVYSAISTPAERLYLSWSVSDLNGAELQPSEVVALVREILPGLTVTQDAATAPEDRVESLESAFETVAARLQTPDVFTVSGERYLAGTAKAAALRSAKRAAAKEPFAFDDPARAVGLFGRDLYISPSRVEDYYTCPFKYFVRHGLHVQALRRAEYDGAINGTVIHAILENIVAFGDWEDKSETELRDMIRAFTEDFIERRMGGRDALTRREDYAVRSAERTALDVLLRLKNEHRLSDFVTRDVELKIADDAAVRPYVLTTDDGGRIILHGTVDRVDTMESGGKVYLRVVDYKSYDRELKIEDVLHGLSVQMLLYLTCLCSPDVTRYGADVVPAGVMYVPAKPRENDLARDATAEQIREKMLEEGRMNGLLLDDPAVIAGTDRSEGNIIFKTKGKTNVISLNRFRLLHRAIDDIVREMAAGLHGGRVEAAPRVMKSGHEPCEYCDYKAICGRESDQKAEKPPLDAKNAWNVLEERYAD